MNLNDLKRLNNLLADFVWFGQTFLQTGTGLEWDSVGGRDYFATVWMEFFKGIRDGTYQRLAEAISDPAYIPYFREDVQGRLKPLLAELEGMTLKKGKQKIKVHINVEKFGLYETGLKQMSRDNIVFDIIQDDDDIRGTYFIDEDPSLIRSYLTAGIRNILNEYSSAERIKIRELETKVKNLEKELSEQGSVLSFTRNQYEVLRTEADKKGERIRALTLHNQQLQEALAKFAEEDDGTEPDNDEDKERMYFLYKLGFLDDAIWNDNIHQKERARIIWRILNGQPLKQGTTLRYYKFFNAIGSEQLKKYDLEKEKMLFDYINRISTNIEFEKGQYINKLRKL